MMKKAASRQPALPEIPEAYIDRRGVSWSWNYDLKRAEHEYLGPIEPGMIFAWEPDFVHARELVIVCAITDPGPDQVIHHPKGTVVISGGHEQQIWTMPLESPMRGKPERWKAAMAHKAQSFFTGAPTPNDEGRFREAVWPTLFNPQHP